MTTSQKIPLSKLSNEAGKVNNVQFATDRIVWKNGEPTIFPNHLLTDVFACALIKYFNSAYFLKNVNDNTAVYHYKKGVSIYLEAMAFNKLNETPLDHIYQLIEAYLKKKVADEGMPPQVEYRIYNGIKSPAHTLSKVRVTTRKQKNLPLLKNIDFTRDELTALVQAAKKAPMKKNPETGDRKNIKSSFDIIERLGISFSDASIFMSSMRAFCAFYITEWGAIRDAIYENFSADLDRHIDRYDPSRRYHMSNPDNPGGRFGGSKLFNPQACFDIAKGIDNPLLTERFVTEYMGVNSMKTTHSEATYTIWDWHAKQSTSNEYDWFSVIEQQYTSTPDSKAKRIGKLCPVLSDHTKKLGTPAYKNTTQKFRGTLSHTFPTKEVLGISKAEEICLALILASDRHQPSNLRWMTLSDITITDNSISSIVDVDTFKRRASLKSGRNYDDLVESAQSFNGDAGETYKKNQSIYKAIICYRDQVLRSHVLGMSKSEKKGREDDLWVFDGTRLKDFQSSSHGALLGRYFKFYRGNDANFGITLCAIKGTLSNKYVLEKCPQAAFFLENLLKIVEPEPCEGKRQIGVTALAMNLISKAAVNLKAATRYSSSEITLKEDSRIEVDDRESVLATERDSALDFHTPKTRTQYVDKLPDYLAESVNFGARVGDEFVRMATELSFLEANASEVMNLADVRKKLGIQTIAETEIEQINELFSKLDSEGTIFDDLGIIKESYNKIIIVRHPIVIAKIKSEIEAINNQLCRLGYSNSERLNKAIIRFMYLNIVLREKFTASEIRQSDDLYGDVEFPSNDILI